MNRIIILAGAITLSAATANAQPPVVVTGAEAPTRTIHFADLNLASAAGQDQLVHRIRAAARDLCFEGNVDGVKVAVARRSCYTSALADGLSQMNRTIASTKSGVDLASAALIISRR